MSAVPKPSDLELAALISSKICHDFIGPVGAIYNGLELLDEDGDPESKSYAMDMIKNVTSQASALLKFARFAFGAAGSAGSTIDLQMAEQISRGFVEHGKHKLVWNCPAGLMSKDRVKLLLNLVANGVAALPRGGEITANVTGPLEKPSFVLRCKGNTARPPLYLDAVLAGNNGQQLDAMSVQAYYTWRLAQDTGMRIAIVKDGADILLQALPSG